MEKDLDARQFRGMLAALVIAALSASNGNKLLTRRGVFSAVSAAGLASAFGPSARAGPFGPFPGEQPADLGVRPDGALKGCGTSPNCWSTSGDSSHKIPPFTYSKSDKEAQADLLAVLADYPQAGVPQGKGVIDGGGNKMVTNDGKYVYVQFTSKKFGFVDDVEFNVDGGKVAIRSASRQGDSDFGVNAARLNFIASQLKGKGGWTTDLGI